MLGEAAHVSWGHRLARQDRRFDEAEENGLLVGGKLRIAMGLVSSFFFFQRAIILFPQSFNEFRGVYGVNKVLGERPIPNPNRCETDVLLAEGEFSQ